MVLTRLRFPSELLTILEDRGIPVRFATEIEYSYPEPVQNAFRKLSEGFNVIMRLGMLVAKEVLVSENEEIVTICGTGHKGFVEEGGGADTAVVMLPRKSEEFYILPENKLPGKRIRRDVKEIICKPR
jgi:hypothetical protein